MRQLLFNFLLGEQTIILETQKHLDDDAARFAQAVGMYSTGRRILTIIDEKYCWHDDFDDKE